MWGDTGGVVTRPSWAGRKALGLERSFHFPGDFRGIVWRDGGGRGGLRFATFICVQFFPSCKILTHL